MDLKRNTAPRRSSRLRRKDQTVIGVIGTGYVGLVAGASFADMGHQVLCVDISEERVAGLAQARVPYFEPGLSSLLRNVLKRGLIGFTTDISLVVQRAPILFVTVGTPSLGDGASDTSAIFGIAREVALSASAPRTLVIKSTAPVGTACAVQTAVDQIRPGMVKVLVNPEFLREGSAIKDFVDPVRIVIGAEDGRDAAPLLAVYRSFPKEAPRLVVSRESAELGKYSANAFLATRISFINEISDLCAATGADVSEVRDIAGLDPRVGTAYMKPGLGYGGSCLPKDLRAIEAMAREQDLRLRFLPQVAWVNEQRPRILADIIARHFGGSVSGHRIAVWGLSFKPATDDVRESPALSLIGHLVRDGAHVSVFDPEAMHSGATALNVAVSYGTDMYGALQQAEVLVLATEWPRFVHADWVSVRTALRQPVVFDGRGVLDRDELANAGLRVVGFEAAFAVNRRVPTNAIQDVA